MISEKDLKDLIGKVLREIDLPDSDKAPVSTQAAAAVNDTVADDDLKDITAVEMSDFFAVENADNEAEYMKLKAKLLS